MLEFATTPLDPGNVALAGLLDREELENGLMVFSRGQWQSASPQEVRVRVLRWHGGKRCTLEIQIEMKNAREAHELVGKTYAVERRDVYENMQELHRAGFDQNSELSIPRPLAYLSPLRLLLEEKIHGLAVREVFLQGDRSRQVAAAEQSARWLAGFHDRAPKRGAVTSTQAQFTKLERWAGRLAGHGGAVADKTKELFRRLEMAFPKSGAIDYSAGHGSFSPDHVLLAKNRTVAIDWDGYDVTDPARDVARFLVATQRLALNHLRSIRGLDWLANLFLQAYLGKRGAEIVPRLPFYRAAMCLKLAKYCAFKPPLRSGEKKAAAMLDEGIRVLGN